VIPSSRVPNDLDRLLSIVDAAYQIERPDDEWLPAIASECRHALDHGFGLAVFKFTFGGGTPTIHHAHRVAMPDGLAEIYPVVFANMTAHTRRLPFLYGPCTTGSEMTGAGLAFAKDPLMQRYAQRFGIVDSIWITAADPAGHGVGIHVGLPEIRTLTPAFRERWSKIASHLAAAHRLRRRLDTSPIDARFTPSGEMEVCSGALSPGALKEMRGAVLALEHARDRGRDPDTTLKHWQPVWSGRWSLLDQFSLQGVRYVVARRNEPEAVGPEHLTRRERQILSHAALGHDNKNIAYDLGISHSTVRVLLARAMRKLGTADRESAVEAYRKQMGLG
jgi:DNA-binding CsgD family transcriptional regulator